MFMLKFEEHWVSFVQMAFLPLELGNHFLVCLVFTKDLGQMMSLFSDSDGFYRDSRLKVSKLFIGKHMLICPVPKRYQIFHNSFKLRLS